MIFYMDVILTEQLMWCQILAGSSRNFGLLQIKTMECPVGQAAITAIHMDFGVLKRKNKLYKRKVKAMKYAT